MGNRRSDFPPGTRVLRHVDGVPGTVTACPPGEHVVVWWDSGKESKHHIKHLTILRQAPEPEDIDLVVRVMKGESSVEEMLGRFDAAKRSNR